MPDAFICGDTPLLPCLAAGGVDPFCTIGTPLLRPTAGFSTTCDGVGEVSTDNEPELVYVDGDPPLFSTINILICCSKIDESSGVRVTVPTVAFCSVIDDVCTDKVDAVDVVGTAEKNPLGAAILPGNGGE